MCLCYLNLLEYYTFTHIYCQQNEPFKIKTIVYQENIRFEILNYST